jgi:outer membrane receptor protein involved in Fe transport
MPSVSYTSLGPGFSLPYFRGVASGENNNHSGPQPSVGMYLDEQPITTITGALDLHIYDIERVEALAGPQGTLYGASSQAGTIRIISNKPDPSGFDAGYGVEGNSRRARRGLPVRGIREYSGLGGRGRAPRRLGSARCGLHRQRGGERTFPTSGICMTNAQSSPGCEQSPAREDNYNDVDTSGRAALRGRP